MQAARRRRPRPTPRPCRRCARPYRAAHTTDADVRVDQNRAKRKTNALCHPAEHGRQRPVRGPRPNSGLPWCTSAVFDTHARGTRKPSSACCRTFDEAVTPVPGRRWAADRYGAANVGPDGIFRNSGRRVAANASQPAPITAPPGPVFVRRHARQGWVSMVSSPGLTNLDNGDLKPHHGTFAISTTSCLVRTVGTDPDTPSVGTGRTRPRLPIERLTQSRAIGQFFIGRNHPATANR